MKTIAIIGPLDTKGSENQYLKQCIEARGMRTLVVDIRTMGKAAFVPDISCDQVAEAAGTSIQTLVAAHDRSACIEAMGRGAAEIVYQLSREGVIQGVIAMGGSQTSSMAAAVMRRLPVGFPKVLVSTIATSGADQAMLAGIQDTFVVNPLVDVGGLNQVLSMVIERAAGAIAGMVDALPAGKPPELQLERKHPLVGISMWGVTTQCVLRVAQRLKEGGYQPLIFHATGIGGHTMEQLIEQGIIRAVAEITLAEFSIPLVGGEYAYDPLRLSAAGRMGIPQVVVPGGCDMVKHITTAGQVPAQYRDSKHYLHNANLLFTRSSVKDNRRIGAALAEKLNAAKGDVEVLFPSRGLSAYDKEGEPLYAPECDAALEEALRAALRPDIPLRVCDAHINDSEFADLVAERLIRLLKESDGG